MQFVIPCLASFLLTAIATPLLIRLAKACNCLDVPGGRRLHKKATPRWGGVGFFAGVLPFLFIENGSGALTAYIIASSLLVGMGIIDDFKSIGWKTKFAGMAVATTIVIFGGDISIHHIGTYGSVGRTDLGLLSIPFTYLSIIGITNAINLLDGLNGLAGGVSLLGFLFMGIAALLAGNIMVAVICFAFVGALGAFLLFNFPNARIFMGDSGSLLLGFSLSLTAVLLTQDGSSSVDSMFPVLVLLIPIFDTLRVLIVRLLNGKNPFKADTLHLHYQIMQMSISPVNVTLLFWSLTAVFGGIALSLNNMTSKPFLYVVLYASSFLSLFAASLAQRWQTRSEDIEQPLPAGMGTDAAGFTSFGTATPCFARKGAMTKFKWIVALGVVLLPAEMFAEEATILKTEQYKVNNSIGVIVARNLRQQGMRDQ